MTTRNRRSGRSPGVPSHPTADEPYLQAATAIGERLLSQAVWHRNRCSWFGYDVDGADGAWRTVYRAVDESLYGGLPGIAWFLAALFERTGRGAFADAAAGAVRQADHLLGSRPRVATHGFYSGLAGTSWAADEVARLIGTRESEDPRGEAGRSRLDAALSSLRSDELEATAEHDLVSGTAGTLAGMLSFGEATDDASTRRRCHRLAERLIETAETDAVDAPASEPLEMAWASGDPNLSEAPLCGLAHGASSGAFALLEWEAACAPSAGGERPGRLRDAAFAAFRYERGWFDRRQGSWPDLRREEGAPATARRPHAYPAYWCHGSAGIGLSRLRAYELTKESAALAEAGAALAHCREQAGALVAASDQGFEHNISLCHGVGSKIDLLLYAHRVLGTEADLRLARAVADRVLPSGRHGAPWRCGLIDAGEIPGLMLGLSGFGLLLLSLHAPDAHVPIGLPLKRF